MVGKLVAEEMFREVMKRHFTPSRSISSTEYLRGREPQLRQIDRAFNSEGKHIFVHGDRGVGKTSLGRTTAFVHGSPEGNPPTIECEKSTGPYQLLRDIAIACVPARHLVDTPVQKKSLKGGLSFLSGGVAEEVKRGVIPQFTSMNEGLLDRPLSQTRSAGAHLPRRPLADHRLRCHRTEYRRRREFHDPHGPDQRRISLLRPFDGREAVLGNA